MRPLAALVLVLAAAALAAGVEDARACSCALPDAREALAQADGAFVGTLVSRRQGDREAVLTFTVERRLKGSMGGTVEVTTAADGAACGIEASVGARVGLAVDRRGGVWRGHLCWTFDPEELVSASLPLPAPNGRGPAALVVGGEFGDVRLLTLDAQGRTLAYGRGAGRTGLVSVCPGRDRLAELAYTGAQTLLVIRRTSTLSVVRRQQIALPGGRFAQRLQCLDRLGAAAAVFARGPLGDSPAGSALYRMRGARLHTVWSGSAFDAALSPAAAYLSAGASGRSLVRVDLASGRTRSVAALPFAAAGLVVNRTGTLLAGVQAATGGPTAGVVRVALRGKQPRVSSTRLPADSGQAQVFWLTGGRLLYAPAYRGSAVVLDGVLTARSRFAWNALSAALVGDRLFGTDYSLSLHRADLPRGPQRPVRRLPGRSNLIVSATG